MPGGDEHVVFSHLFPNDTEILQKELLESGSQLLRANKLKASLYVIQVSEINPSAQL